MQYLELKSIKNKDDLINHIEIARNRAMIVVQDMYDILHLIEALNRAVIFEHVAEIKTISKKLRLGERPCNRTYVEGFSELIDAVNTTTAKCSKAKVISM